MNKPWCVDGTVKASHGKLLSKMAIVSRKQIEDKTFKCNAKHNPESRGIAAVCIGI